MLQQHLIFSDLECSERAAHNFTKKAYNWKIQSLQNCTRSTLRTYSKIVGFYIPLPSLYVLAFIYHKNSRLKKSRLG